VNADIDESPPWEGSVTLTFEPTIHSCCFLGLPDKTRPEEDHASCQFNPAQEPFSRPIQPAANPTKLSEEMVTPLHGLANLTNPGLSLAPRRGLQAETGGFGTLPGRSIPISPIRLGRG